MRDILKSRCTWTTSDWNKFNFMNRNQRTLFTFCERGSSCLEKKYFAAHWIMRSFCTWSRLKAYHVDDVRAENGCYRKNRCRDINFKVEVPFQVQKFQVGEIKLRNDYDGNSLKIILNNVHHSIELGYIFLNFLKMFFNLFKFSKLRRWWDKVTFST